MARILSQTLFRESQVLTSDIFPISLVNGVGARLLAPSARLLKLRSRSNLSEDETESSADVEINDGCLDDDMSGVIARRSSPSWLPFVPGSSYWVPPKKMPSRRRTIKEVGAISFRNVRGWPSSTFFVEGT